MLVSYNEEKNRRQVPKVKEYISLKEYCDVLYCYLQVISEYNEETKVRYVPLKDCKFTTLGKALNMSRQTVSKKMKFLEEEMNLIKKNKEAKRYELTILDKTIAELVPFSTLRVLTNTLKENVISTYVYLLIRYRAEGQKPFKFTYSQIKNNVGIGISDSTNYIVIDYLNVLEKLGLLKVENKTEKDETTGEFRSVHIITEMSNKIDWD